MFDTDIYVQRRKLLVNVVKQGVILFLGNEESPMNYADNTYPFRQHSSFLYYFGIDRPSLAALIDIDAGTETLFGDDQSVDDSIWTGSEPTLQEICGQVGVEEALPMVKLFTILREAQAAGRQIHFLSPYRPENKIKLLRLLNIRPDQFSVKSSEDLVRAVVAQREIKSADEISEIEKAVDLSANIHIEVIKMVRPGMTEFQIAAKALEMIYSQGWQPSFPIIATSHGEILHNHPKNVALKEGGIMLFDCGAETPMHYAGDLTSSFPVSRKFTQIQRDIYSMVLGAQHVAVSMLYPGVPYREAHLAACRSIFDDLKSLGLTKGNTDDAISEGVHALFLPCGTGHALGLDVHDMEDLGEVYVGYDGEAKSTQFGLKSLRLAKPMREGFTFTVEPGIYFIPDLIDMWRSENRFSDFINYDEVEKFKGFGGIRNEENYVITSDGCRRLGRIVKPSTIEDIERLRQW